MKSTKVACIQAKGNASEPAQWECYLSLIEKAATAGAGVIALPELFLHPYFPIRESSHNFDLAHDSGAPPVRELRRLAKKLKAVIIVPCFEKAAPGVYFNSVWVVDADGSLLGTYRKMHIPDDPGFYEKYYFSPGDLGYRVFHTRYGKVGVLICWDQWFPEAARLTALKGCQILFYPTAIGWDHTQLEGLSPGAAQALREKELNSWKTIQQSHAIANGVYVAAVNRVGLEEHLEFWGHSFIADPHGSLLTEADDKSENFILAECPWSAIDEARKTWPFLRDRRVDSYGHLSKRIDV